MTCQTIPFKGYVVEDGGATFLARVNGNTGVAITQALLSSITVKVFDLDSTTPDTSIYSATVSISSCVFDTLQTDAIWTEDTDGYNFKHAMPASAFPTGGHNYRIEYLFTPTSGEVFWVLFEVLAIGVITS